MSRGCGAVAVSPGCGRTRRRRRCRSRCSGSSESPAGRDGTGRPAGTCSRRAVCWAASLLLCRPKGKRVASCLGSASRGPVAVLGSGGMRHEVSAARIRDRRGSQPHISLFVLPTISPLCSCPTPSSPPGSCAEGLQLRTEHPSCEHPPQSSAVPAAPASIPPFGDTQVPAAPTALLPVGFLSSSPAPVVAHIGAEPRVSPRSQLLASLGGGAPGAVWLLSASSPLLFKSLRCPAAAASG